MKLREVADIHNKHLHQIEKKHIFAQLFKTDVEFMKE